MSSRLPFGMEEGYRPGTPLAERMRPATLAQIVGQVTLVGEGGLIQKLSETGELPSLIFWGPPGCGKTTVARILAGSFNAEFVTFSAVLSGVKEVRAVMEQARALRATSGRRTVLFVDEVHRFNKSQQDAFLPFVESGDIVLLGATTENPSFELNAALLSRTKVIVLEPLKREEILILLEKSLTLAGRGLGDWQLHNDHAALEEIANLADGDARVAYNLLEMVAETVGHGGVISVEGVRRACQRRLPKYDKEGEDHYNLISALHKSIRNSDVDASLYYLARMLDGGANPRFVARRLLRVASEDVGMADPRAIEQVSAAAHTVEVVGMPECALALAQAAVYLCLAAKSNALYTAYGRVQRVVRDEPSYAVPLHIRNAPTKLMSELGYSQGYVYAHDQAEKIADMECLPAELSHRRFYEPSEEGWEKRIRERLAELAIRRGRAKK